MTNILVVGLYTASTVDNGLKRFSANYRFIDDCKSPLSKLSFLLLHFAAPIIFGTGEAGGF